MLIPIRIFNGSLGGVTLYQNQAFVSPNEERSMYKKQKGDRYVERVAHNAERRDMAIVNKLPPDLLSSKNVFADD